MRTRPSSRTARMSRSERTAMRAFRLSWGGRSRRSGARRPAWLPRGAADRPRAWGARVPRSPGGRGGVGRGLGRVGRHGPPGECLGQAGSELVAVELDAAAVTLQHGQAGRLDALEGGEARPAGGTPPAEGGGGA